MQTTSITKDDGTLTETSQSSETKTDNSNQAWRSGRRNVDGHPAVCWARTRSGGADSRTLPWHLRLLCHWISQWQMQVCSKKFPEKVSSCWGLPHFRFDCPTGRDIDSICTADGTWAPYPTCQVLNMSGITHVRYCTFLESSSYWNNEAQMEVWIVGRQTRSPRRLRRLPWPCWRTEKQVSIMIAINHPWVDVVPWCKEVDGMDWDGTIKPKII